MISFLTALLALLVPILLILIVRVRTRQRVLYSHTYLRPLADRSLREFLFSTFQLYYDVAFDLLLALLLALILAGLLDPFPRRTAVCLDGSFSMTRGQAATPLDKALRLLAEGKVGSDRYRLFLLGFDPKAGRHALVSLGHSRRGLRGDEIRTRLRSAPAFFSADPRELGSLYRRGFRRVIYITDRLAHTATDLEVIEVGAEPAPFVYPLAAVFQEQDRSFRLRILRSGFDGPLEVERFYEEDGEYRRFLSVAETEPGSPFSELEIRTEGLYRVTASLEGGTLDFLLPLRQPAVRVLPKGEYSSLMASLLPGVVQDPAGIPLYDLPWNPQDPSAVSKTRLPGVLTVIPPPGSGTLSPPYLQPLADCFSQPVYTEMPAELFRLGASRLFFQDPRRIRDAGTPLAYLSTLEALRPRGPLLEAQALPRGARLARPQSGATCYAFTTAAGLGVLNLPPEELFPLPASLSFSAPPPPNFFYVLLLLVPYGLKLLFQILWQRRRSRA